jgi:hypothetical protein
MPFHRASILQYGIRDVYTSHKSLLKVRAEADLSHGEVSRTSLMKEIAAFNLLTKTYDKCIYKPGTPRGFSRL